MKPLPLRSAWLVCLACLSITGTALATTTILQANFDAEPVDTPIATGGPSVGEPVSVTSTITAIVRPWPYATPSLKINDADLLDAGFVSFRYIDSDSLVSACI